MGKIIKDGFAFMEYVNSRLIRKPDDIPELKNELITLSEGKTHIEISEYAVLLGEHILELSGLERSAAIEECVTVNKKWQNGEMKFQDALLAAGWINRLARDEKKPVKAKALRAMGQIAATPHVRYHALAASEYAIVIINLVFPGDFGKVEEERRHQIELINAV